jgi:hypothetical protein
MSSRWSARRRLVSEAGGNVAIVFGLALVPLIGLLALAIDFGVWSRQRTVLQGAADSGSLAGLRELINAVTEGDRTGADARATALALNYIKSNRSVATVTVSTVSANEPLTVTVNANERASTYFSHVLFPKVLVIGVVSEAVAVAEPDACIIALDPQTEVGVDFNLSREVVAHDCSIWSNSQGSKSISGNGSGLAKAATTCAVGGAKVGGGFHFEPNVKQGCLPARDPLANWNPPDYGGACTKTNLKLQKADKSEKSEKPDTYTLDPGVYCGGIAIRGGAVVNLKSGVYIIKDGPLSVTGGGVLKGSGVSLLLSGSGAEFDFGGASVIELSAITSGAMAGMVLAARRDQPPGTTIIKGSSSFSLEGHVYLPTQNVVFTGGPQGTLPASYTTMVGRTITFNGSSVTEFRKNTSGGPSFAAKVYSRIHLNR